MHSDLDSCDCEPLWFDKPGGAATAVAVSAALLVTVLAVGWGDWTGSTLGALGASLVALGLSLANLRDALRRRSTEPPPTVIPLSGGRRSGRSRR